MLNRTGAQYSVVLNRLQCKPVHYTICGHLSVTIKEVEDRAPAARRGHMVLGAIRDQIAYTTGIIKVHINPR